MFRPNRQATKIAAEVCTWVLAPVQFAALATSAKSYRDNRFIGSPALNRAGLHIARMRLAQHMAERRRQRLAALVSPEDRAAFSRDGFIVKRDFLPPPVFTALKQQVLAYRGPAREQRQGDAITRRIALDEQALLRLPAVRELVEGLPWLNLVRYVGSSRLEPLIYLQTIFSRACGGLADPQTRLHADTFHSTVKAWFFLNDVGEHDAAFVYVPGSHRLTPRRLAWERRVSLTARHARDRDTAEGSPRIDIAELRRLGLGAPLRLAVPANTLIVADTLGFHARGEAAQPCARVEIWAYGRRNPFLPWLGLDFAGLPGIKGRAVPLYWAILDFCEKLRIAHNPWRSVGILTPL